MEKDLEFKPMTDGLGFHPFSDGLPYAPVSKTPAVAKTTGTTPPRSFSSGTGAVAAGRPQFVVPRKSVQPQVVQTRVAHAAIAAAVKKAPPTPNIQDTDQHLGFGYVFKRIFAYFLDTLLSAAIWVALFSLILFKNSTHAEDYLSPGLLALGFLVWSFFHWLLMTGQELVFRTTFGKRAMGLKLFGDPSAIFVRAFFFVPSVLFCGMGLAWCLFDRRRRCWHDLVADLAPTEIAHL